MQPAENPTRNLIAAVRLRHDGRVLLEVLEEQRLGLRCVATAERDHDDRKGIASALGAWIEHGIPDEPGSPEVWRTASAFGGWEVRLSSTDYSRLTDLLPQPTTFGELSPSDVALQIPVMFRGARDLAAARLADPAYITVLERYLADLRALVGVDQQLTSHHLISHGIGRVLDAERYLRVAEDARVRELLAAIDRERTDIYNWYMDLVKGGQPPTAR